MKNAGKLRNIRTWNKRTKIEYSTYLVNSVAIWQQFKSFWNFQNSIRILWFILQNPNSEIQAWDSIWPHSKKVQMSLNDIHINILWKIWNRSISGLSKLKLESNGRSWDKKTTYKGKTKQGLFPIKPLRWFCH